MSSFDLGRGCPFQCSFCTIINVQGRKSRFRIADDLEAIVRENFAQGIKRVLHHRRQFGPQPALGGVLRPADQLRENEGMKVGLIIQVDTLCHRIPNFIDKAARAGVLRVFIGLENINPDNLLAAKKRQNKITEYRQMLQAWHDARRLHLGRLHPRLPRRHARSRSCATWRSSSRSCRSTSSSSSS